MGNLCTKNNLLLKEEFPEPTLLQKTVEFPLVTIKHKCKQSIRVLFKIEKFLQNLKPNSQDVIQSFNFDTEGILEVVYRMIETTNFSWEYIKDQVEQELLHYVLVFHSKQYKGANDQDNALTKDQLEKLWTEFQNCHPTFYDNKKHPFIRIQIQEEIPQQKKVKEETKTSITNNGISETNGETSQQSQAKKAYIQISGQMKDKLTMETIGDSIKKYYKNSFKRTFLLFPQGKKGQKNQQYSNAERYYIWNYLQTNKDLLILEAGIPSMEAQLLPSKEYLEIKVDTVKGHFDKIRQNLNFILQNLVQEYVQTSSYISLNSDSTSPLKGNDIRKRLQDTFNVTISYPVFEDSKNKKTIVRGSGQIIVGNANQKFGILMIDQTFNYTQLKEIVYVITGKSKDVQNSVPVIRNKLASYKLETENVPRLAYKIYQDFTKKYPEISNQTDVNINYVNNTITYIGEQDNIDEAKQEIKEIISQETTLKKKYIKISPDYSKWILESKNKLNQIANPKENSSKCQIYINKKSVQLKGSKELIKEIKPKIISQINEIKSSLFSIMITDRKTYNALLELMKEPSFSITYSIEMKKVGDIKSKEDSSSDNENEYAQPSLANSNAIVKGIQKITQNLSGYLVVGKEEDLQSLMKNIQKDMTDPEQQFSEFPLGDFEIKDTYLKDINGHFKAQYPLNSDLLDISFKDKKITVSGSKHKEILLEVMKIVDKIKSYRFQDHWENVVQLIVKDNNCIVFDLQRPSQEWKNVEVKFKATMKASKISRIQRIQNLKKWRAFKNEVDCVKIKNEKLSELKNLPHGPRSIPLEAKLEDLFYGTRSTPPEAIYKSEEGFNLDYSGMWGKANYFAQNSSYSNQYASVLESGERQLIMATVIIGIEAELNSESDLKEAPLIKGTKYCYDSVKGHRAGSDVVLVYSNKQVYPSYLITYK